MPEQAYRYECQRFASCDEWDNVYIGSMQLRCDTYEVVKHTPKGFWLQYAIGGRRFVLTTAKKQYAHLTHEAALQGFIKRRERYGSILQARMRDVSESLALAADELERVKRVA